MISKQVSFKHNCMHTAVAHDYVEMSSCIYTYSINIFMYCPLIICKFMYVYVYHLADVHIGPVNCPVSTYHLSTSTLSTCVDNVISVHLLLYRIS